MNRKFSFSALALAVFFVAGLFPAFGQRQTNGRPSIEGQVLFGEGMDYKTVAVNGGSVTWNNYQYLGHTSLGVEVFMHPHDFVQPAVYDGDILIIPDLAETLRAYDFTVGGGYFIRALSTRSRSLILSFGVSVYAGVRYCKEVGTFVKDEASGKKYSPVGFLLNAVPEAQLEVFPFSNVSFYASARPRLRILSTLAGEYGWFHFSWGGGIKYYF